MGVLSSMNEVWVTFFFFGFCMALLIGPLQRDGWKQGEREVGWCAAKGPGRTRTPGRCSDSKVSAHGTPALPTELMGAPEVWVTLWVNKTLWKCSVIRTPLWALCTWCSQSAREIQGDTKSCRELKSTLPDPDWALKLTGAGHSSNYLIALLGFI